MCAEGLDHGDVEAAGPEGRVGDIDDLVAGGIESGTGGAGGDRLAGANLAGDDPQSRLLDAMQDAGDRLLVRLAGEQLGRGE